MDPVIQAISGVMSVTGQPDDTPLMIGAPLADVISGMFAAYTIVGALHAVATDGCGRYIDLSMQAAMIATMGPRMGEALQAGISPKPLGNQNPMRVPSDVYFTRDRVPIFVMVQNDRLWVPFCRAIGKREWISDSRFVDNVTRVRHRTLINDLVKTRMGELDSAGAIEALEREGVPFARVYNYAEALADPQVTDRGLVRELDHPRSGRIRVVGPPWIISDHYVELSPPPTLGQHTADVLQSWLGWDAERSARFKAQLDAAEPAS